MHTVGVRELKARLSHYLRLARGGEPVMITDRGRPVARLVPEPGPDPETRGLWEMAARGLVRLPEGAGKPLLDFELMEIPGRPLSDTVLEDRR
ncbi:MAG: type II toxin-antitoxin system prevent-host-death family antitoxin [Candidatus Dadabacteria bacterium]|nr:MAG: type II toxin-antitoxin system prevent-host-death family antitoxin [Candidatus Dadabacteria bacterium]